MLPEFVPVVTLIELDPCPEFKDQPLGMVQVYELAPGTVVIEYVSFDPGQENDGPEIDTGTDGTSFGVTFIQVETLHPHELHAATHIVPVDVPTLTVMLVVPCPDEIDQPVGNCHW